MLLLGEADVEASVVEIDDGIEIGREAVVEVGRTRGDGAQHRPLKRPMSFHLPVIRARPGSVVAMISPVALLRS